MTFDEKLNDTRIGRSMDPRAIEICEQIRALGDTILQTRLIPERAKARSTDHLIELADYFLSVELPE